jgi:hypothetical protein
MTAYELRSYAGGAAETTLASDITNAALSIPAASTAGYADGTSGPAYIIIDFDNSKAEKIRYTSLVGSSFVVPGSGGRAQDGTTAVAHSAGAKIRAVWSATDAGEANKAAHYTVGLVTTKGDLLAGTGPNALGRVAAGANNTFLVADSTQTTGVRWTAGPAGAMVGTTDAQTLTNKTVALGSNTVSGTTAQFNTALSDNDFATLAGAETLTNKTLNGATFDATSTIGGVSGTSLAADRTAWTSYTPTFTNLSSPTGEFYYKLMGKTLHLHARFTGGTVTASAAVSFTLPAGLSGAARTQLLSGNGWVGGNPDMGAARMWQVSSGATTVALATPGGSASAGNTLANLFVSGTVEVA